MPAFNIKTNRIFTRVRKWSWLLLPLVAVGGLWYPKLGLIVMGIMIGLIVMSLLKGKYWCGNFCPHGSLFDQFIMAISLNRKIPKFFHHRLTAWLAFFGFMYMIGSRLVKVASLWGSASFIDRLGLVFVTNYLVVTIIGSLLAALVAPRTWCTICPMGTVQMLFYRLGKRLGITHSTDKLVTVKGAEMCHSCGKCARVCPMQLTPYLEFSENGQFNNDNCIRCSTCVHNCPAGILSLSTMAEAKIIQEQADKSGYEERRPMVAVISRIEPLADDINEYTFKLIDPEAIDFKPGQFILVKIQDDPPMFRAFSIASPGSSRHELKVTIKRAKDGYGSNLIFNKFKVGDQVHLEGPMGNELVPINPPETAVLVAGGIGVTPFVPLAQFLLENGSRKVVFIHGAAHSKEFVYSDHFNQLASEYDTFEYIQVAGDADDSWQGEKGKVTDILKRMNLKEHKAYLCGPPGMIDATIPLLKTRGVLPEDIYYESA